MEYTLWPVSIQNSETTNLLRHLVMFLVWGIGPSQGIYLHRTTQHEKTWTYASMSRAGFETAILVFKRTNFIRTLDHTVFKQR